MCRYFDNRWRDVGATSWMILPFPIQYLLCTTSWCKFDQRLGKQKCSSDREGGKQRSVVRRFTKKSGVCGGVESMGDRGGFVFFRIAGFVADRVQLELRPYVSPGSVFPARRLVWRKSLNSTFLRITSPKRSYGRRQNFAARSSSSSWLPLRNRLRGRLNGLADSGTNPAARPAGRSVVPV